MVSGDRQVAIGEKGPFHAMQRRFSRWFERVDVLCPRAAGPVTTPSIYGNVFFHTAPVGRSKMARWIARAGAGLVRDHGHELIVSHDYGWFYNGLGSARVSAKTRVPYLSEIHHVPGHPVAADWRERFDKRVARAYVRWARSRAVAFRVVNAGEMPGLLARWGVPREQIVVLPSLYIDLDVFRPPASPVAHEQDVVFVGRMVANKGLDRIVDALGMLSARGRPARALFVGKGPLADATRERVRKRGLEATTRFVPWVETPEELALIYQRSRVCVCASTCEGGPRFTVEAMACATPVVSTPVGVMSELLAGGERGAACGFDVESLADALDGVLRDEPRRQAQGRAAHAEVQRFEYARTIDGYARGLYALAGVAAPAAPADTRRAEGAAP